MSEFEPRPVQPNSEVDWRRIEVAAARFEQHIAPGIATALADGGAISSGPARCIAHVLGRAGSDQTRLAAFGRDGEGGYVALRDEYLGLYHRQEIPPQTKEWIGWLAAHLIIREGIGPGHRFQNEHLAPQLERILLPHGAEVRGEMFSVFVPATADSRRLQQLDQDLTRLEVDRTPSLAAFLSLSDVDALSELLMESFHDSFLGDFASVEDAVRALSPLEDWETELERWANENGLEFSAVRIDLEVVAAHFREVYDLVEVNGRHYAFVK